MTAYANSSHLRTVNSPAQPFCQGFTLILAACAHLSAATCVLRG